MIWEMLNRELIFPDMSAVNYESVMEQVGGALTKAGYVKDTYVNALIDM